MSVIVGAEGRVVLPKEMRKKYGVRKGSRLIVRDLGGQIVLIPVATYEEPTDALHASIPFEKPIQEPKQTARVHVRKKLTEELA